MASDFRTSTARSDIANSGGRPVVAPGSLARAARAWRPVAALLLAAMGGTAVAADAGTLSSEPVAASAAWTTYVRDSKQAIRTPVRVVSTEGTVVNAAALLDGGETTLSWRAGTPAPVLVLDYGSDIGGLVSLDVVARKGATDLQIAFSETLDRLGPYGDGALAVLTFGGSGDPLTFIRFAQPAPGTLNATKIQGGFRYQRLTLSRPGSVTLKNLRLQFTPPLRDADAYQGYFLSDNEVLNRAWFDSAHTITLGTVTTGTPANSGGQYDRPVILDGAKRDRGSWIGDLLTAGVAAHVVFGSEGDASFSGSLDVFAAHPATFAVQNIPTKGNPAVAGPMPGVCRGPITDVCKFWSATYSMHFVMSVYSYWMETGDLAQLRRMWPLVKRELAWEQTLVDAQTGLVDVPDAASYSWAVTKFPGKTATANVLHYASLTQGAALAAALGESASAALWTQRAAASKSAIQSQLWNETLGAFDPSTTQRGGVVQDANVMAILYGVASSGQSARILALLDERLKTPYGPRPAEADNTDYPAIVSPFMGSFHLYAHYLASRPDLALAQINDTWGWMSSHDPQGTSWERIRLPDGTLGQAAFGTGDSAAHAWSAGPIVALSRYVLGIQPVSAGYASWRVRPQPQGLHWAQGQVPTAAGAIASRWTLSDDGAQFKLTVAAPATLHGSVDVPLLAANREIWQDGKRVWDGSQAVNGASASRDGDYVHFTEISGTHTWAWSAAAP